MTNFAKRPYDQNGIHSQSRQSLAVKAKQSVGHDEGSEMLET